VGADRDRLPAALLGALHPPVAKDRVQPLLAPARAGHRHRQRVGSVVQAHAIDEEGGRRQHVAVPAGDLLLVHRRGMNPGVQLAIEARDVQPDGGGQTGQPGAVQPVGALEQLVVHLPVAALRPRRLGRLRRLLFPGKEVAARVGAEDEAHVRASGRSAA
jgi:hypothetical protein